MNRSKLFRTCSIKAVAGEDGSFLLELAIILPLLFLLFFGGIAANEYIVEREAIEFVVREAARGAFHKCRVIPAEYEHAKSSYIDSCFQDVAFQLSDFGKLQFREFKLVMTFYQSIDDGRKYSVIHTVDFQHLAQNVSLPTATFSTKNMEPAYIAVLKQTGAMIFVEAYAERSNLLDIFFGSTDFKGEHYAVAIS